MLFTHRVTGLLGCWFGLMFDHPSAWVADRDRPAATSVPNRAANVCHLADTTGMNPVSHLVATTTRNSFRRASAASSCCGVRGSIMPNSSGATVSRT